jgi:hypothetical protein
MHRLEHEAFSEPSCSACARPWTPAEHPLEVTTERMIDELRDADNERDPRSRAGR